MSRRLHARTQESIVNLGPRGNGLTEFAWQEGYAAFTVSPTARKGVCAYIANQEEHHRVKTFREELIELLKIAGVEFDPKYLD